MGGAKANRNFAGVLALALISSGRGEECARRTALARARRKSTGVSAPFPNERTP